jgi:hypothetical protein
VGLGDAEQRHETEVTKERTNLYVHVTLWNADDRHPLPIATVLFMSFHRHLLPTPHDNHALAFHQSTISDWGKLAAMDIRNK